MTKAIEAGTAKLAGLQIDLLTKVKNGVRTLEDLEWFMKLSQPELAKLRGQKKFVINALTETSHLRLISGEQRVVISPCAGGPRASLAYADKTFTGYLDSDFKNWKLDTEQLATGETEVAVYEMHKKDGTLRQIFDSFNKDLKTLAFQSQEQIEKFAIENRNWLRTDGYGTLFLFIEKVDSKEQFFVARVSVDSDELELNVGGLSSAYVWHACRHDRVVVPATGSVKA